MKQPFNMLDEIKALGFLYATKAGISIGIDDLVVPQSKAGLVKEAEKEVIEVEKQYQDGVITHGERYNKVIAIWAKVTDRVADEMFEAMETVRPGRRNQSYLHHGGLRRAWFQTTDSPALRHARIDGKALGRNH